MLASVADVANDEDVGSKLLFDLHVVLLDECVLEVGRFGYERKTMIRDRLASWAPEGAEGEIIP